MRDLHDPKWMYLKAALFIVIGCASAALILGASPTLQTAVLLVLVIWSFCRAYYFAFYVIEKYVDSNHKFSGLCATARYLVRRRRS